MSLDQALEIASATDPGMVRSNNEDSIASDAAHGLAVGSLAVTTTFRSMSLLASPSY